MSLIRYIEKAQKELGRDLTKVSDAYIKEGRQVLIAQGHYASGSLDESFESEVVGTFEGIVSAEISFNEYGLALDTGVRPDKVKYAIKHLIPWAKIKHPDKSDEEIKNFLHATRTTHKTEGIGTKASSRFSSNGKRTGWIGDMTESVDKPEDFISFDRILDIILEGIVKNHGKGSRT